MHEYIAFHPVNSKFRQSQRLRDLVNALAADGRSRRGAAGKTGRDEDVNLIDCAGVEESAENRTAAFHKHVREASPS